MRVMIQNARLSFPKLFKPEEFENDGNPMYSCSLILDPKNPAVKAIRAAIEEVGKAKFEKEWETVKKAADAKDLNCLHDGDNKDFDGYAGNLYVSCRALANKRPTVIDRNRQPLTDADGVIYGGCYVNAAVELWAQKNRFGKRVNAQITGVQFVRDGDSFGGGVAPESADSFTDLGEGADAGDVGDDDMS